MKTISDVGTALRELSEFVAAAGSEGHAHYLEDKMRNAVLIAIAQGEADDPKGLAQAVLASAEIEFSRWYA